MTVNVSHFAINRKNVHMGDSKIRFVKTGETHYVEYNDSLGSNYYIYDKKSYQDKEGYPKTYVPIEQVWAEDCSNLPKVVFSVWVFDLSKGDISSVVKKQEDNIVTYKMNYSQNYGNHLNYPIEFNFDKSGKLISGTIYNDKLVCTYEMPIDFPDGMETWPSDL